MVLRIVLAITVLFCLSPLQSAFGQYYLRPSLGTSGSSTQTYRPSSGANFGGHWSTYPQPSFPPSPSRLPPSSLSGSGAARGVFVPAYPPRAPYTVPYGPSITRPPGSPSVPFGSSRYYYKW